MHSALTGISSWSGVIHGSGVIVLSFSVSFQDDSGGAHILVPVTRVDGREPLVDPMCGSGTIPIEAFLLATGRAPGMERTFAIEAFPSFDSALLR